MISKTEIKKIRSLDTKKGRDLHNRILIEGKRLVEQVMLSDCKIDKLWITEDFNDKNINFINKLNEIDTGIISGTCFAAIKLLVFIFLLIILIFLLTC